MLQKAAFKQGKGWSMVLYDSETCTAALKRKLNVKCKIWCHLKMLKVICTRTKKIKTKTYSIEHETISVC